VVVLPDTPLHFDARPVIMEVFTPDGAYRRHVQNPAEGKFLLYAQRAGHRTAHLPQQPVEVRRTVTNYERYLRDLRKQLYEAYFRRTMDAKSADRLTQAAWERFRLPTPDG